MSTSRKTPVTKDGTPLTPGATERLADEAEVGYDLARAELGRAALVPVAAPVGRSAGRV
jgi:hypothetical protein